MSISQYIQFFESHWISPCWAHRSVLVDPALDNYEFKQYLQNHDIEPPADTAPETHEKALESNHGKMRNIYLRLKGSVKDDSSERIQVQQELRTSNDLYGSEMCSGNELAKDYTRPIFF